MVGEPLVPVYRACQKLKVQMYDTQERTKWKVRDVYLRGGDDDYAEDDEDYEGWVVEYYPAESPSDPSPSGAYVEWIPVGWIKVMGCAASSSSWFLNDF